MPTLSYGLNITKKIPPSAPKAAPARLKAIFDGVSEPEDGPDDAEQNPKPVTAQNDLQSQALSVPGYPDSKISKMKRVSKFGDLSTNHSTSKHAETAQSLDPSIYEYDDVYDSLHSSSKSLGSSSATADEAKQPKYMKNLLSAAETRKRDQLRAKEKMLAKERELEGDEFADKEKFVTSAYKRQQEDLRKAEAEEALREHEAAERQRKEGGGLKGMYKSMLQRDEEKHASAVKAVEEARRQGTLGQDKEKRMGKGNEEEKSEVEIAREKGVAINEEGQVVDKRLLLNAGLNAGPTLKVTAPPVSKELRFSNRSERRPHFARKVEAKASGDQLLGKRGSESGGEDDVDGRASKSRKMEDAILASLGL